MPMLATIRPRSPIRRRRAAAVTAQAGFSILELLVYLGILGLLVGLVAPAVVRQFGSAKQKVAEQSIARLGTVLDIYRIDVGAYPSSEQGLKALVERPAGSRVWNGPYATGEVLNDPWGQPLQYRRPSQRQGLEYDIFSLGSDGRAGGTGEAADVYNRQ